MISASIQRIVFVFVSPLLLLFSGANARAQVSQPERNALIAIFESTNGDAWANSDNWRKAPGVFNDPGTECTWFGVFCNAANRVSNLDLRENQLRGEIPSQIGDLSHLTILNLSGNQLSGPIPPQIGNLADLTILVLYENQLSGEIPTELSQLGNLTTLDLEVNQLSGSIPVELYRLANLINLSLLGNRLTGPIPAELGQFPNLQVLKLAANELTGPIPPQLGGLTSLRALELWANRLSGEIPVQFSNLQNLHNLNLDGNQLSGGIPPELATLPNLGYLQLGNNQLSGEIPGVLANLASLESLGLSGNALSGPIPSALGRLANLSELVLRSNRLTGTIPLDLGQLFRLRHLDLAANELTGPIPFELGNLTSLEFLDLSFNQLNGVIPGELGQMEQLRTLILTGNQVSGLIPIELGQFVGLQQLQLARNQLEGPIPPQLGNLGQLNRLFLQENQLSGAIPPELGQLNNLTWLSLQQNRLEGSIPAELGQLASLEILNLSGNRLSGAIPTPLAQLTNLFDGGGLDLRSNSLFSDDLQLRAFLDTKDSSAGWEQSQEFFLYFAQFGAGPQGFFSEIVLLDRLTAAPTSATIAIRDDKGNALEVELNDALVLGQMTMDVPPRGMQALKSGTLGSLKTGSVTVRCNRPLEGVVLFGGDFGLAGVGSSQALDEGFLAPMQIDDARQISTGVAVMNLEDRAVTLQVRLLGPSGDLVARALLDEEDALAPHGHLARFVNEFPWDQPIDFSDFFGLMEMTASGRIAATVLQTRPDEFVTLPVLDRSSLDVTLAAARGQAPELGERLRFAQFGDGGGTISSQVLLLNPDPSLQAMARIDLRGDSGQPLQVDLNGELVTGELETTIPAFSLMAFETDGSGELTTGSVTVSSDLPLSGVIVFGGSVGFAGVGSSAELASGFVAPMQQDAANQVRTGVAIMNLEVERTDITVELLDAAGQTLATATLALDAVGHRANFLDEFVWDNPVDISDFRGLIRVTASGTVAATVIQKRPGQFATMPVAPMF